MIIDFGSRPPLPAFHPANIPHMANYNRVYKSGQEAAGNLEIGSKAAMDEYLRQYDEVDARAVLVHAKDVETTFGAKISNEDVAEFCGKYGKRFIGFGAVDPHKGYPAVREITRIVSELGLKGLNLQCFELKLEPNDKMFYPIYAKCIELDIPVVLHSGINFSTRTEMKFGRPMLLDEVLVHFPELRIVAMPPGWPWIHELVGVAWRHKTLSIGLAPVRPIYLTKPDAGYEPLLQYGNSILADQMIFATSFPLLPIVRTVQELQALPLKPENMKKWLYGNAARLLKLDPD